MLLYHAIEHARQGLPAGFTGELLYSELDLSMRLVWHSLNLPMSVLGAKSMPDLITEAASYGRHIPGAPLRTPAQPELPNHCDQYEDRRDDWRPMPRPAAMVGLIIIGATLLPGLAALALPATADTVPVLYQSEVERLSIMGWLRDTVAALIGWVAGTISEMTPGDFFCFLVGTTVAGLTSCLFAFHWVEKIGQNKEAERWAQSRREIDSL